jgi:hypothetical protein
MPVSVSRCKEKEKKRTAKGIDSNNIRHKFLCDYYIKFRVCEYGLITSSQLIHRPFLDAKLNDILKNFHSKGHHTNGNCTIRRILPIPGDRNLEKRRHQNCSQDPVYTLKESWGTSDIRVCDHTQMFS